MIQTKQFRTSSPLITERPRGLNPMEFNDQFSDHRQRASTTNGSDIGRGTTPGRDDALSSFGGSVQTVHTYKEPDWAVRSGLAQNDAEFMNRVRARSSSGEAQAHAQSRLSQQSLPELTQTSIPEHQQAPPTARLPEQAMSPWARRPSDFRGMPMATSNANHGHAGSYHAQTAMRSKPPGFSPYHNNSPFPSSFPPNMTGAPSPLHQNGIDPFGQFTPRGPHQGHGFAMSPPRGDTPHRNTNFYMQHKSSQQSLGSPATTNSGPPSSGVTPPRPSAMTPPQPSHSHHHMQQQHHRLNDSTMLGSIMGGAPPGMMMPTNQQPNSAAARELMDDPYGTVPMSRRARKLEAARKKKKKSDPNVPKTTVMLRNIPNKYSRDMVLDVLHKSGYRCKYNFFYLPIDFRNRCNLGYCFINFDRTETAEAFMTQFHNYKLPGFNSQKVCQVGLARVQGQHENIEHYRNSPVMASGTIFELFCQ